MEPNELEFRKWSRSQTYFRLQDLLATWEIRKLKRLLFSILMNCQISQKHNLLSTLSQLLEKHWGVIQLCRVIKKNELWRLQKMSPHFVGWSLNWSQWSWKNKVLIMLTLHKCHLYDPLSTSVLSCLYNNIMQVVMTSYLDMRFDTRPSRCEGKPVRQGRLGRGIFSLN